MVDRRDDVVVDDRRRDVVVDRGAGGATTALAWIALIVAVLALAIAWMAYNRTGEDLESRIQNVINESAQSVEEATDDAAEGVDEGPDGVDEDDTDLNRSGSTGQDQSVQNQ